MGKEIISKEKDLLKKWGLTAFFQSPTTTFLSPQNYHLFAKFMHKHISNSDFSSCNQYFFCGWIERGDDTNDTESFESDTLEINLWLYSQCICCPN
jgi:hypothetical protein